MPDGFFPDVSEFQPNVSWPAFVAAGLQVAICRAWNGYRLDAAWKAGRQAAMRSAGVARRGFYMFLVSDVDPSVQARAFLNTVGPLQPGEFLMVDSEAVPWHPWTPGQQRAWTAAACLVLAQATGREPVQYSDEATVNAMGGPLLGIPLIVAAYGRPEPSIPHMAWQYTDGRYTSGGYRPISFPGIGVCDTSVYHGDLSSFDTAVGIAPPGPAISPARLPAVVNPPKVVSTAKDKDLGTVQKILVEIPVANGEGWTATAIPWANWIAVTKAGAAPQRDDAYWGGEIEVNDTGETLELTVTNATTGLPTAMVPFNGVAGVYVTTVS